MENSTKFSGRILRKFSWRILQRFYKILHEEFGKILQNQFCQKIPVLRDRSHYKTHSVTIIDCNYHKWQSGFMVKPLWIKSVNRFYLVQGKIIKCLSSLIKAVENYKSEVTGLDKWINLNHCNRSVDKSSFGR